jgi:hypothetical protein
MCKKIWAGGRREILAKGEFRAPEQGRQVTIGRRPALVIRLAVAIGHGP